MFEAKDNKGCVENRQGEKRQFHSVLVHRCPRGPEDLQHHPLRAGGGNGGGDGLRRLLHRGILPDRGERHDRHARSHHLPDHPLAALRPSGRADDLRHPEPRRQTLRGRPPLRPEEDPQEGQRPGLHLLRRAGARVLLFRLRQVPRVPRHGRLLRRPPRGPGDGPAPPDDLRPPGDGDPRGVQPPRGGPEPARDRPALRRGPQRWPTT